jgi:hypothetical protein
MPIFDGAKKKEMQIPNELYTRELMVSRLPESVAYRMPYIRYVLIFSSDRYVLMFSSDTY